MNLIDFLIGGLLMNAMPHFIFGIANVRFLGMFGYGVKGNMLYAFLQFVIALALFHMQYGISQIFQHGMVVGAICVLVLYFCVGKVMVRLFSSKGQ